MQLKKFFSQIAETKGFSRAPGYWFRASDETIVVLDLQRSMYSPLCYLNVKIYLQGIQGRTYAPTSKELSRGVGDVFRRAPVEYEGALTVTDEMQPHERTLLLQGLFDGFLTPLSDLALSRAGVMQLGREGTVYLLPAIQTFLAAYEN